jgi:hypothetical protein
MPTTNLGQLITFASVLDPDAHYAAFVWIRAKHGDTLARIARRRGHPEWAPQILKLNLGRDVLPHPKRRPHHPAPPIPKLRNIKQRLRTNARIKLPGTMGPGYECQVLAGDNPPTVTSGYAKFDTVDVSGRIGINRFLGYDPLELTVPIQFQGFVGDPKNRAPGNLPDGGGSIDQRITILERMAGRGDFPGAGQGPPAVIKVTVTDNTTKASLVPLIPLNLQAMNWRITAIAWDANALRNDLGRRVVQTATITLTQYTPTQYVQRSLAQRTRSKAQHATNQAGKPVSATR